MTSNDLSGDRPRRILLIEDSELDRCWLRVRLASDRVQVLEASDGAEGLRACQDDPPDFVLLDLGLPHRDGFETLHQLKNDNRTSAVPVIVVSATTGTEDIVRGLDGGAVDYVTKPYDLVELQARIRVALRTKRLLELLEQRAHVDGLTGLSNRLAFEERLSTEWALLRRHGGALAVWIADLDHFKQVNDAEGHAAGDEVLRRTAEVLRASVRSSDMAARYGGEEFVVIAPRCGLAGALKTADRFRERVAATPITLERGTTLQVTVSVGVASAPEDGGESAADLLARADRALYQAKAVGRNRVIFTPDRRPLPPHENGWALTPARVR